MLGCCDIGGVCDGNCKLINWIVKEIWIKILDKICV